MASITRINLALSPSLLTSRNRYKQQAKLIISFPRPPDS